MTTMMKKLGASIQVLRKAAVLCVAATGLLVVAASAHAQSVQNGGVETTTNGYGQISNGSIPGASVGVTAVTNWTTGGYNFVMDATNAQSGVTSQYGLNDVALWTSLNGGTGTFAASPDGGNFVALDGDWLTGAISQSVTGLTPGNYAVSFYWAASQQAGFYGPTQQSLTVSLGSQSQTTSTYYLSSQGFSGWMAQTDTFTASSSSEVLSFLANGNVQVPPFVLLDGVSITRVPEGGAATIYLLLGGAVCFGSMFLIQRKKLGASQR